MNRSQIWSGIVFILICCCVVKESQGRWPNDCCENGIIRNETCYMLEITPASYYDALMNCIFLQGNIAMMKDSITQMLIMQKFRAIGISRHFYVWAGIKKKEGKFVYEDLEELGTFKPWKENQPNGMPKTFNDPLENCVSADYNEEWDDEVCSKDRYYACEFKKEKIPCSIPDVQIPHAEYEFCQTKAQLHYDEILPIKCHEGYILVGPNNITCLEDGKWSTQPQCMKGCQPPKLLPHSSLINLADTNTHGSQVVYICDDGYVMSNQRSHLIQTCDSNSKWVPENTGCTLYNKYKIGTIDVETATSINLPCIISDDDQLKEFNNTEKTYLWFKNSEDIAATSADYSIDDNGTLRINNMSETAVGQYNCFQNNSLLIPASLVFDLKLETDICPQFENKTEKITLREGTSTLLKCPHTSSDHDFTWYKDGKRYYVRNDQILFPDGILYTKALKYFDQGIYTCQIREKKTQCKRNYIIEIKIIASLESICGNADPEYPHPWAVSLWQKDEIGPFCYGALIHERWVVTSAQCLAGLNRRRNLHISVQLGYKEQNAFNDNSSTTFEVNAIKIHQEFNKKVHANDIGLVQLQNPIHFTHSVRPICLTETDLTLNKPCNSFLLLGGTVVGWGQLEKDNFEAVSMLNESMLIDSPLSNPYTSEHFYFHHMLRAKKSLFANTTFAADTGSPLEVLWKDRHYLFGIYSWGERATLLGDFDYYTKVSKYASWLKDHILESEAV